jgi:adenylate kinase family enzyme
MRLTQHSFISPACHTAVALRAQDVMLERLLKRAQTSGRPDDNEETIRKRFQT